MQFNALVERHDNAIKEHDYRAGLIVATMHNMMRDEKTHPQPFTPDYFFASLEDEETRTKKEEKMSPETMKNYLKLVFSRPGNVGLTNG